MTTITHTPQDCPDLTIHIHLVHVPDDDHEDPETDPAEDIGPWSWLCVHHGSPRHRDECPCCDP